ncbi:MAG: hypothetical protein AVDCRST_MAG93-984 [uncultured Chloroflexia bacterium]|uniref:Uncharacterized protein n=1 Tax=uncultured Chloroflexia bacterium TaxID=1672391 RepID=A0A6J4HTT5_9CHLR|nr:MAG: hypothetical protein AVDCRST_MAG93-984 [uncultured Chloroflexia bacterium]
MPEESREEIQKRSRTTIEEAEKQGIGEPAEGIELPVPSYADSGGVSDLGADEPVVPVPLRGNPPPDAGKKPDGGRSG